MMDITKSQSDFEVACRNGLINYGLAKFENGEYASESTRAVFSGWLAGRESIEVELPTQDEYDDPLSAYNAISDCKKILRTAGIRIKGESE
ncbi:hypothetical protein [Yersinia mollaretii]|uniref:hypothetical protein n=1 Tax=Yersinia mollaretii TaxID=33060 RepID=UPI0021BD377E|nr:hypothetical protein [Yersinia mollaretii]